MTLKSNVEEKTINVAFLSGSLPPSKATGVVENLGLHV